MNAKIILDDKAQINALRARLQGLVYACRNVNISDSIANERYKGQFVQALAQAQLLLDDLPK